MSEPLEVQTKKDRVSGGKELEHAKTIQTRTMAELFVQQGSIGKAIKIFRQLVRLDPSDVLLHARLAELENQVKNLMPKVESSVDSEPTIGLYFQNLLEFESDTEPDDL